MKLHIQPDLKSFHHRVFVILPDGTREDVEGVSGIRIESRAVKLTIVSIDIFARDMEISFRSEEEQDEKA